MLRQFSSCSLALTKPCTILFVEDSCLPCTPSCTSSCPAPRFLSLEGALYVLRQFFQLQLTPNIESPSYSVLQKFKVQNLQCLEQ